MAEDCFGKMLDIYVYMSQKSLDDSLLEKVYGIDSQKCEEKGLKTHVCTNCGTINGFNIAFCENCDTLLDEKLKLEMKRKDDLKSKILEDMDMDLKEWIKQEFKNQIRAEVLEELQKISK